jgi:hypothetical protein
MSAVPGPPPQVVAGGSGEDGRAVAQEELRFLLLPLHDQHAGTVAQVEEGQKVGDLEAREFSFENLIHGEGAEL